MGTIVRLNFKAKRIHIPLASGRIVLFDDDEPKCLTDEEANLLMVDHEVIGECDSSEIESKNKSPFASHRCGENVRMQCDFEWISGTRTCIRCGRPEYAGATFRSCSHKGLGDRVKDWIEWTGIPKSLGFGNCHSCSERRRWLNQWDRNRHRKRWVKKHGNRISPTKARVQRTPKRKATAKSGRRISESTQQGERS